MSIPKATSLLILFVVLFMGCGSSEYPSSRNDYPRGSLGTGAPNNNSQQPIDNGDLLVQYTQSKIYGKGAIENAKALNIETLTKVLNKNIAFKKRNIPIIFTDCGIVNAAYHSGRGKIYLCYEFLNYVLEVFKKNNPQMTNQGLTRKLKETIFFIFLHELGHAFVHELDLPVTGKEEDAADQLATIILTSANLGQFARTAGELFSYISKNETKFDFFDEHSLSAQRFANILCWVIGSDPEKYKHTVNTETYNRLAKRGCGGEYKKLYKSWNTLLKPHSKN